MQAKLGEATREYGSETAALRGDAETSATVAEAVRDVCDAIRLVRTNVERFVSRAAQILP